MRRFVTAFSSVACTFLLLAPVALAANSGEGLIEATDKKITNAGFILIAFFPTFILLMSLLQYTLDRRKDRRKAATKARGTSSHWNAGW